MSDPTGILQPANKNTGLLVKVKTLTVIVEFADGSQSVITAPEPGVVSLDVKTVPYEDSFLRTIPPQRRILTVTADHVGEVTIRRDQP